MKKHKIVCTTNEVDYLSIRRAMCEGARTVEEVVEKTGVCTTCEGCIEALERILGSICGCYKVPLQAVVDAVRNGADTLEKVGEVTGAGTKEGCGKCSRLIANVIELGR